ncbi:MAG: 2-phosphosulfolactate phosphatase [Bacteroidales bacterium]
MSGERKVEVCLTPDLIGGYPDKDSIVVIIDVFRATSTICSAFANGVKSIIPVAETEEARIYKEKGYLVAGERDGIKLDFADFGNSPENFAVEKVEGKTVAYTTTNGTGTIHTASDYYQTIIGSFLNAGAVVSYLKNSGHDVLLLCAGWKGRFNLEDTLCAGYITSLLLETGAFRTVCDSALASVDLWKVAEPDVEAYIQKAAHRQRLRDKHLDHCITYCLSLNITDVIPVMKGDELVSLDVDVL